MEKLTRQQLQELEKDELVRLLLDCYDDVDDYKQLLDYEHEKRRNAEEQCKQERLRMQAMRNAIQSLIDLSI